MATPPPKTTGTRGFLAGLGIVLAISLVVSVAALSLVGIVIGMLGHGPLAALPAHYLPALLVPVFIVLYLVARDLRRGVA